VKLTRKGEIEALFKQSLLTTFDKKHWNGRWTILGDYESTCILNCIDNGRKRIQCLGMTDTLFPAATILPQISAYQAFVDSKVPVGQHVIWIDSTAAGHWYTESMIDQIVNYLE
jgi:hypothetical protein